MCLRWYHWHTAKFQGKGHMLLAIKCCPCTQRGRRCFLNVFRAFVCHDCSIALCASILNESFALCKKIKIKNSTRVFSWNDKNFDTSFPIYTNYLTILLVPGHCDAITSLVTHLREPLLISGSRDKTIRIWNFDTFAQTFCLQTGEEILHVDLICSSKLYYRSNHSIKVWHINLFHTLFATLSSKIIRIIRVESPEYPARILVHAIDGGIRLISPVTGCQLTAMLPITTLSSSIVDVCHDRRRELLYIVLGNRQVLVFESDSNPCWWVTRKTGNYRVVRRIVGLNLRMSSKIPTILCNTQALTVLL